MAQLRSFLVTEGCVSLLQNALTIPSVLHMIHNMLSELVDKLSHWEIFRTAQIVQSIIQGGEKRALLEILFAYQQYEGES